MSNTNDGLKDELNYMLMMGQDTSENIGRCNYCGNISLHFTRSKYKYGDDRDIHYFDAEDYEGYGDQSNDVTWYIQECTNCKGLFLKERRITQSDYDDPFEEFKILYPATKISSDKFPSAIMK